ncbi:MAG: hypothetical protein HQ567_06545 [Candidatus Nealsonbacteria bacterium]|nr:hypothetical protein [Candidatus Nealsonbacteria bacterium]
MTNRLEEQLLGHLLGALDDRETQQISARLETELPLQGQLASLRGRLATLEPLRDEVDLPPGLAERTCRLVASYEPSRVGEQAPGGSRRDEKTMTPCVAPPGWFSRVRWQDVVVTTIICTIAWTLISPAIVSSRENSRLVGCQNNFRIIGSGVRQYGAVHGSFPLVPGSGPMASPGAYSAVLRQAGLLNDPRVVQCPGAPMAGRVKIYIPLPKEFLTATKKRAIQLRRTMGGSYGLSFGYVENGKYHAFTDLSRSNFALIAELPSLGTMPGYEGQSLNHGGRGQNVLFEDGRVRFLVTPRFNPGGDDIYANDEGLPAPGVHPRDSVIAPSILSPLGVDPDNR